MRRISHASVCLPFLAVQVSVSLARATRTGWSAVAHVGALIRTLGVRRRRQLPAERPTRRA